MKNLEQPKVDIKVIKKRAKEAAEKAYLSEIDSYYTDYGSPYKKLIKAELEKQKFNFGMKLPDILSNIQKALSDEVDAIANRAIANTYIPMISDALVGLPKNITMTEFLKEVVEAIDPERDEFEDFSFSYNKHERHGWLTCELTTPESNYEFTLHTKNHYGDDKKEGESQKYQLLSFPSNKYKKGYNSQMTVYKDDVKIEMPFTPNVLADKVLNLFFKLMLSNSAIDVDVSYFDEDIFPEDEHCHC